MRGTIATRARDGRLSITIRAQADASVDTSRSGLATHAEVLEHLAQECAGLLDGYAALSESILVAPGDTAAVARAALQVLPRGRAKGLVPFGFRGWTGTDDGLWATPRSSDAKEFARLLLANPHLSFVQTVSPINESEVDAAREELTDDIALDSPKQVREALGTPVRVSATLVAVAEPWTLPLRTREHLRGWFNVLDLDETTLDGPAPGAIVPEAVAAGLLRFPTTVDDSFPGMSVVPPSVAFDAVGAATDGIRVGVAFDLGNQPRDVFLDDEAMSRHVHVIGESGSGKSTLLTAIAVDTARRGGGMVMLDPHGTTVDRILAELPEEARDRVWVVRCGDPKNPVRLNPFAVADPDLQDVVISDMLDTFQALFDPKHQGIVGPRFLHMMRHILSTLAELRGERASILDVPRLLYDAELRKAALPLIKDPEVVSFWANDIQTNRSNEMNELIAWVSAKFTTLAANRPIKAMLATGEDSFDPIEAMATNRIILIDLDKGAVGSMGARMLGLLYLLRFWVAALGRDVPEPFTILVDEAASFSAAALPAILSEGRKFGLRAVVAHQYMGQLDPQLAEAIEGSVATRMVFRVGPDDARELAVSTHPEFVARDLSSMPQFVSALRMADSGTPIRPFTLTVDHNKRVRPRPDAQEAVEEIRARSVRDLVDPYRDARPMTIDDLHAPSTAPGSALDEWLARRTDNSSRPLPG